VTNVGRIAWVVGVGASRGLGAASARRFARVGYKVAVTGRSPDALQVIVDEIMAGGGQAIQQPVTLSKRVKRLIFSTGWRASALLRWPPLETKTADFEVVWWVGCLGGFIFGREVARRMLPRGYGTIIYSGASAALRGRAAFAAFAAAKAGLRMVSQSFAREFGPRGITSLTSSSTVPSRAIRSLARFLISGSRRDRTACCTLM
jgi:NAD(P)-dependent dehydrogenase (short-subunit alcohol dehydrogenase family)